ncbi:SLC13 family permease [Autumnicola musiva]|uniref:Citrate transporter-like domain-containing protein n=1 Tax=Autumnicola musiva TaxID=3075589 RepID=A0ABU3D8P6_9FLAO|nr:SLC13 family permease [Zunongwangia sp. F117]MDT0677907.1 hypothetical protein [Zunongwangia sp. F117]
MPDSTLSVGVSSTFVRLVPDKQFLFLLFQPFRYFLAISELHLVNPLLVCAGVVMLTGCVPITKSYSNISWTSVVMIAAMIPMGAALEKIGLAQITAGALVESLGANTSNSSAGRVLFSDFFI